MDWKAFYDPSRWTLGFWAYGSAYTIVPGRHIGLDIGTKGVAKDVPAVYGGKVVHREKTNSMGWVVVLDTGLNGNQKYHAYCHLSGVNLPSVGSYIGQGGRVGKLAAGPRGVSYSSPEYPGAAWTGVHLHLVMTDKINGAYIVGTGATFYNPETFIRNALAAPSGTDSKPFTPIPGVDTGETEMIWIAKVRDAYYLVVPQGGGKPRAVQLDGTGYLMSADQNGSPYAKIPQISFKEQWSIDRLKAAVDGI